MAIKPMLYVPFLINTHENHYKAFYEKKSNFLNKNYFLNIDKFDCKNTNIFKEIDTFSSIMITLLCKIR